MLDISNNSIDENIKLESFKSFFLLKQKRYEWLSTYFTIGLVFFLGVALLLPWTQNIRAKGYVTTRSPEQRPQSIQSVLAGKLERWHVKEGDYVQAGDTIVYLSEVKSEYFDPDIIARTSEQVKAKEQSVGTYDNKIRTLDEQYKALQDAMNLKLQQAQNKIAQTLNKVKIDSIDLVAAKTNFSITETQLKRTQKLYQRGIKSRLDLEEKQLKYQESQAKVIAQENKLANQRNELQNLRIEVSTIKREYADKLAKSQSEKLSALSGKLEATAVTAKLKNQLSNYQQRQQLYYVTAPQSGYITKALKKGIGEIVKEGTDIVSIMPEKYDLAVELYVKPNDLPLLEVGTEVRLSFDGWPAIVVSGWPEASSGIFAGKVLAIDQFISENGKYRLLIVSTDKEKPWPANLRVGAGANAFLLLKEVPLWYELWRQLNGFPPDYYKGKNKDEQDVKLKAPIKKVK